MGLALPNVKFDISSCQSQTSSFLFYSNSVYVICLPSKYVRQRSAWQLRKQLKMFRCSFSVHAYIIICETNRLFVLCFGIYTKQYINTYSLAAFLYAFISLVLFILSWVQRYVLASTRKLRYDSDSNTLLSLSPESVYNTKTHKGTAAAVTQLYTSER